MSLTLPSISLLLALAGAGTEAAPDGKALFLAKKCNICHSVSAAGIAALKPSDGAIKISDISGLSAKRKVEWLSAYLEKKEKLDDKSHPTKFRGKPGELEALVAWLMSLKPAP